ncbi:MAG: asparagine synthase (glutamine-hydrolyzing) [Desulfobacterales bacterium]|nr:asparagine synthase (glutamine-hydrolyzing) [Desulfobacterales bacterium]
MCGIAGIAGPICDQNKLDKMGDVLKHRGPDDFKTWIGKEEKIGFSHRRLSIIDPKGGSQPMKTTGNRFVLCYNGEVYNYLELRNELYSKESQMRENWTSSSDVEVLLYMMQQKGIEGLKKLNGMFAFALWDEKENKLFAARDRLGIKPFYYYYDGESFIFASEIKAIIAAGVKPELDNKGVAQYIELQYCLKDRTMFKGIKRLLPGHYLEFDYYSKKLQIHKYWDIPTEPFSDYDEEKYIEEISFLLNDAMRIQLRSDFPIGFHLSGGLDSSTICCLASRLKSESIKTFTGGFKVNNYDESHHAKYLSDHIGAQNFTVFPTSNDLIDSFKHMIYMLDEPVAGAAIFPQYFLSKLISENNVKVALGGQGGDELFCGYVRYLIAVVEDSLKHEVYSNGKKSNSSMNLNELLPNMHYLRGYEPLMKKFFSENLFGDFPQRYYHMMKRTTGLGEILHPDFYKEDDCVMTEFVEEFNNCESNNIIDKMSVFDIKNHLQSLLHLEDRASMAWSVESRIPLLDHRIVETVMRVPAHKRIPAGNLKHLFKRVAQNILPEKILNRTDKKGFPVPISEWFKEDLNYWVKEILLSKKAKERGIYNIPALEKKLNDHVAFDRTIWGLLSLEFWFQNYFD